MTQLQIADKTSEILLRDPLLECRIPFKLMSLDVVPSPSSLVSTNPEYIGVYLPRAQAWEGHRPLARSAVRVLGKKGTQDRDLAPRTLVPPRRLGDDVVGPRALAWAVARLAGTRICGSNIIIYAGP
jgi:hypothetical protein